MGEPIDFFGQKRYELSLTGIFTASETFNVGIDFSSFVSLDFHGRAPSEYNSKIDKVSIKYFYTQNF